MFIPMHNNIMKDFSALDVCKFFSCFLVDLSQIYFEKRGMYYKCSSFLLFHPDIQLILIVFQCTSICRHIQLQW